MSTRNDITGDLISSIKGDTESYSQNFGRIFGEKLRRTNPRDFPDGDSVVCCSTCGKDFVGQHTNTKCGLCDN